MSHELIISGIHLELTSALKEAVQLKMERLFKHETRIIRLRIELERASSKNHLGEFVAKGHITLSVPKSLSAWRRRTCINPWICWWISWTASCAGARAY